MINADGLRGLLPDRVRTSSASPREQGIAGRPGPRSAPPARIVAYAPRHHRRRPAPATTCCSSASSTPSACRCPTSTSTSCERRRDEVIDYVRREVRPATSVAQIITFGTMQARAAIRDVGRVLGMPYGDVDRIAKAVPNQLGITSRRGHRAQPRSSRRCTTSDPPIAPDHRARATQLEGVARNASTHAAGVVISREPLDRADAAPEGHEPERH
ncbi:MAG: hypothetical protein MZW92_59045 [Comamonadaceae bacterium]|nr:hypothetical protein [Comamonadaceae bacterium]